MKKFQLAVISKYRWNIKPLFFLLFYIILIETGATTKDPDFDEILHSSSKKHKKKDKAESFSGDNKGKKIFFSIWGGKKLYA